ENWSHGQSNFASHCAMLRMETSQMTRATRSVSRPLHSVDTSSLVTNHSSPATASGEAKKRLIATHANSEISPTHSKHRVLTFSNRNTIPVSAISSHRMVPGKWSLVTCLP